VTCARIRLSITHHRRHCQVVGLAGADPDDPLERHDEDLAVTDLVGSRAVAEGIDGRLHERVGDRDLEAHLVGEPDLDGRSTVGLDRSSSPPCPARG
jgi:hypothetical protein